MIMVSPFSAPPSSYSLSFPSVSTPTLSLIRKQTGFLKIIIKHDMIKQKANTLELDKTNKQKEKSSRIDTRDRLTHLCCQKSHKITKLEAVTYVRRTLCMLPQALRVHMCVAQVDLQGLLCLCPPFL